MSFIQILNASAFILTFQKEIQKWSKVTSYYFAMQMTSFIGFEIEGSKVGLHLGKFFLDTAIPSFESL